MPYPLPELSVGSFSNYSFSHTPVLYYCSFLIGYYCWTMSWTSKLASLKWGLLFPLISSLPQLFLLSCFGTVIPFLKATVDFISLFASSIFGEQKTRHSDLYMLTQLRPPTIHISYISKLRPKVVKWVAWYLRAIQEWESYLLDTKIHMLFTL